MTNLMFIGPCIVIYFYSKTNEMHQFFKFILFCSNTLHITDGLSREFHLVPTSKQSAESFDIYLMLYVQS